MTSNQNNESREAIKREIKEIRARCMHAWNVIDNSPLDAPNISNEQIYEKMLCYIEGLRMDILNPDTPITADENLITSQFLNEIKDKTTQVEEMTAFLRGSLHDMDAEIERLKTLITNSQEVRSRPKPNKNEVRPEHVAKAKEKFRMMKNELHGWINILFPETDSIEPSVMDILRQLMAEHLNEESDGYIPITSETFHIIKLLQDMKIVAVNPYNQMEFKLAY